MQATTHDYHPQARREAGARLLAEAEAELERWTRAWAERVPGEDDDYLRHRLQGAKVGVGTWRRYIKAGCRRIDGTD